MYWGDTLYSYSSSHHIQDTLLELTYPRWTQRGMEQVWSHLACIGPSPCLQLTNLAQDDDDPNAQGTHHDEDQTSRQTNPGMNFIAFICEP